MKTTILFLFIYFFTLTLRGQENKICDEEIEKYYENIDKIIAECEKQFEESDFTAKYNFDKLTKNNKVSDKLFITNEELKKKLFYYRDVFYDKETTECNQNFSKCEDERSCLNKKFNNLKNNTLLKIKSLNKSFTQLKEIIDKTFDDSSNKSVNNLKKDDLSKKDDKDEGNLNKKKDSSASTKNIINVKNLKNGLSSFDLNNEEYSYYIVDLNDKEKKMYFFLQDNKGRIFKTIKNVDNYLRANNKNLIFAINGGMYLPNGLPKGLFISEGKTFKEIDIKKDFDKEEVNFYIQPNGVFYIDNKNKAYVSKTDDFFSNNMKPIYATQSGPMLLTSGRINSYFNPKSNSRYIRNGVGILPDGRIIFIISENPVTFYNFAEVFLNFNCTNALYLDGAISKMFVENVREVEESFLGPIIGLYSDKK